MLNPYVPGNAGATSATSKKGKLPADPLNSPMQDERSRGPMPTGQPLTSAVTRDGEPGWNTLAPRPTTPSSSGGGVTQALSMTTPSGPAGGTGLTNIPSYQFAEDRLTDMLSSNSRYMQNARRAGLNAAASRGGINSSIAGGYAEAMAIDRAAPIATADAQFTQEDYLTGRRALLDDIRSGNDSGRRMTEDVNRGSIQDSLAANENVREMGRMNLNADLTNQRDNITSRLRRQEMQFESELSDSLRNNDAQRQAWLTQQSSLSSAYASALTDSSRVNLDFISRLGSAFIDDPEVYSPEVVTGMSNFFNNLSSGVGNSSLAQILRSLGATGRVVPSNSEQTQPVISPAKPPVVGG